jgi:hypothetical protein
MTWGATQKGTDTLPLGSVGVPGTLNPVPLQGSPVIISDSNGNTSAGVVALDQLQAAIMQGKAYAATTGILATSTNGNLIMGASLFMPAAANKNLYVYSAEFCTVTVSATGLTTMSLRTLPSDPAYANVITPLNLRSGGANSVASVTSAANGATASLSTPGTLQDLIFFTNPGVYEFIGSDEGVFVPAGTGGGIAVYNSVITAGQSWAVNFRYIEF